ncbi:hypothetical protein ACE193_02885 [Bernardetia sp. OM2101]|uniref:hypothetical protein n=1 Tax=Bernardetia sp. OM2101 TaxID=3344876 RepID=UPI0035D0B448
MKLLKFVFVFALISFLSACGNDDDENTTPSGDGIIGTWKVTEIDYTGTTTASQQGVEFEADFEGEGVDMDLEMQFDNNMNYTTSGDYSIILTTSFFGQSIEQRYDAVGFVGAGTWSQDGDQIIISSGGETNTLTVLENSGNTLKVEWNHTQEVEEQGTTQTLDVNGTYTFERQ